MRLAIALLFSVPLLCPALDIPQGSHVALRLVNSVTTRTAKVGDYVYMTTATPIAANDRIVIPVGSYVQGVVSRAVRSGRVKGRAELGIRIDTVTLPEGRVIRIAPRVASVESGGVAQKVDGNESQIQGGTSVGTGAVVAMATTTQGAMIGGIAERGGTGAAVGAGTGGGIGLVVMLLMRNREVELRQGATVDAVFDRAIPVD